MTVGLLPGEIDVKIIAIEGLNMKEVSEIPLLEPFVLTEDLKCKMFTGGTEVEPR